MRTRTARLLIVVLALVCAGLILSVVYPVTMSDPHARNPSGDRFTVGEADSFSATGRIVVDGETRLAFDGAVAADGAWYERVVDGTVISEKYHPSNGAVYERLTIKGRDAAEQRRNHLAESERRTILRESQNGSCVTFVIKRDTTRAPEPVSGTASVLVNNLWVAGYQATDTDSSGVTTYRPQPGWYEGRVAYRITDVSGIVRATRETNAVTSANVSMTVTPGKTYAQYVLSRVLNSGSTEQRTTYVFNATAPDIERPAWVTDRTPGVRFTELRTSHLLCD